ncbi:hydrolase [Poriferisphaera sp. WC338]|uniref:hydrolase n=1 Tax=Poriferisphaera sp. WC338 TaxID=3425129 RepID=UPI003D81B6FD
MQPLNDTFSFIDTQHDHMVAAIIDLANINSHTFNLPGLSQSIDHVLTLIAPLNPDTLNRVPTQPASIMTNDGSITSQPLADTLIITKRPTAPLQAILCIHLDTVYPPDHPLQSISWLDDHTLNGPGVIDAKGGLVTLITALHAFEQSFHAQNLGWKIILNPDEEIGSPGSASILKEHAPTAHFGMVYEPALPNGNLISHRKGSGNFSLSIPGTAAHAGRDFFSGNNALLTATNIANQLAKLTDKAAGTTVNIAALHSGGPFNVVPGHAILRFNVRLQTPEEQTRITIELDNIIAEINPSLPAPITIHGSFNNPPKPLTSPIEKLIADLQTAGQSFGLSFGTEPSGGVCDGNKLAAAGLPNIDTLGPRGNFMHSDKEQLNTQSLTERCKLSAALLIHYASGTLTPPNSL